METVFQYAVMGTTWKVTLYDEIGEEHKDVLQKRLQKKLEDFDSLYSRFKETSLVSKLSHTQGVYEVPQELIAMLRVYKQFYEVSHKKFTPCIGTLLEDVGYDARYSLQEKSVLRDVPDFNTAVEILDDTHLKLNDLVLLDLGAIGKGYFVDVLRSFLKELGYKNFLVDGSGDIYYETTERTMRVGLEHPHDKTKVIGIVEMPQGAMCSSATNRRRWGKYSHYIDPDTKSSPSKIVATWVMTPKAVHADALSSLLFFIAPEELEDYAFEYCIMNDEGKVKKSPGFQATFF